MVFVGGIQHHIKIAGVQTGLLDAGNFNGKAIQRQAGQRLAQHGLIRAQIQQSGRDHIAADAGIAL